MSGLPEMLRKAAAAFSNMRDYHANAEDADCEPHWSAQGEADEASKACSEAATEIERHPAAVEQAFRDGLTYATNCVVTDPDEAWRTSRARRALHTEEAETKPLDNPNPYRGW